MPQARQAVAIILLDSQQVLMIRRADTVPRPGIWSPPTGRVEIDETPAQAAVRETAEELGIAVRAQRRLWKCQTDDGRFDLHWWLVERCELNHPLRPAADEVAELRWISPSEFAQLHPHFPQHRPFFADVLPSWLSQSSAESE